MQYIYTCFMYYSKTCVKHPLSKRPKIVFQDQSWLNAGQKYCRMLRTEHSAILLTFIKQPFVIKIFVLSIFEWPFYIHFTACTTFIRALCIKSIAFEHVYVLNTNAFNNIIRPKLTE